MKKRRGRPVVIGADGQQALLERVVLGAGTFNEDWLQALIHNHPSLLPVSDIEPGFGDLIPVAREVPCAHGYIDNLYVTPAGDLVLVETKLWRNVQARREVVAQALDYVAALTVMDYEGFEAALFKGDCGSPRPASLFALVAEHPDALDEAAFVDTVSLNLQRGRMLVIVLGDGIRQEVEALAGLLQSHAGAHFTFALVELATWKNRVTGEILAVPDTLAQTVMIERGIVMIKDGRAQIEPAPITTITKAQSITEAMFYETLAQKDPGLPAAIRDFLARVEPYGVYPDLKASLNLKVDVADANRPMNLGYITRNGQLRTGPLAWTIPKDLALQYNQALADLIGGIVTSHDEMYVSTNGKSAPPVSLFLPAHAKGWEDAIQALLAGLAQRQERPR